jgi:hypothetical protein
MAKAETAASYSLLIRLPPPVRRELKLAMQRREAAAGSTSMAG